MLIWDYIEGFSRSENWGDPDKLNGFLLLALSAVRHLYREEYDPDAVFIVHYAYDLEGHVKKSEHYRGNAVDFHIKTKLNYLDQINALLDIFEKLQITDRVGFGIYPDWNNPGFHFDCRGEKARWGRVDSTYLSFKETVLYIASRLT